MATEPTLAEEGGPAVPTAADVLDLERRPRPRWMGALIGTALLLVVWELLAVTVFASRGVLPTPWAVVHQMARDLSFYRSHVSTTLSEAVRGYLWGNLAAIALAVAFVLVPTVERALLRVAIATYCMPIIAIGPILQIVFDGNTPKVVLAALSVFFTTLIGTVVGLRSADQSSLDLVRAYGGGGFTQLRKVRLRAALPSFFAGLRIAAPAAVLGAIIGEYLGGESGLGVAMINSQQAFEVARTWGLAFVATILAGVGYGLTSLAARASTPWARDGDRR